MASIKDAVEESFQDNNALTKYFLFAVPLYITYYLYSTGNINLFFYLMAAFSSLLILGILTICTQNVRNNTIQILPGLNIFKILAEALHCLLAIGPASVICVAIAAFITTSFTLPSKGFDLTIKILIWCAFSAVIFTSYLLFIKDKKIKDAYNLKSISDYGADIMVSVIFMVPQILLANTIFLGAIAYVLCLFLGFPNPILDFVCCMFVIQNMAMIGNYLAQIALESIETKIEMQNYDSGKTTLN